MIRFNIKFVDPLFNPSNVIVQTARLGPVDRFDANDLEGQGQVPPYTITVEFYQ